MSAQPNAADELSAIVLEQADRIFRGEVTKARLEEADRGEWPADLWSTIEENGLTLAMVPEEHGGAGLAASDALKLVRLAGYYTLPLPLAETMLAAALWAEASGEAPSGVLTFGPSTPGESLRIAKSGSSYRLDGTLRRVPWAERADQALLFAADAGGAGHLVMLPKGTGKLTGRKNLANDPRDTLALEGVTIPEAMVRPASPSCRNGLLAHGALLRTQQMAGAMERAMDHALTYVMERKQFGRELAKFQAIQHMLAEAAGHYAASSAAADGAREAYGQPQFEFAVALAKSRVGDAVNRLTDVCHQVHGAMGYTQEHPLHFATRRLWAWREEYGAEIYWQERIGRLVCARGGEALWDALTQNQIIGMG